MSGMSYIDGTPYVWGKPAIKDDEPPLLDCFSQWKCPHCHAPLSGGAKPICLNACHLTAPQLREMHGRLRAVDNEAAK